jgi:PBSX family phage terminase large subunit
MSNSEIFKGFTLKQKQLLSIYKRGMLKRINILEGSVRSGKTWISLVLWAAWVASQPKEHQYLMCAKSLQTLKRNCLDLLQELVGKMYFKYSLSKKEGFLFGRKILLEGVNDARAEGKIRGLTLNGAYCDELTLFDEDFFKMLLSRLSLEGAKLIGTTNPDLPSHWLKKQYIDKKHKLDMLVMKYLIDDNTHLPKTYIENLKKEYTGVFYDRFILGLWVAAEGAIYRYFTENIDEFLVDDFDPDKIIFATIGVDFGGNSSAHAFKCVGYTKGFKQVIVLDEYYKKGASLSTPKELECDFVTFVQKCKQRYKIADIYCDSAESLLIKGLKYASQKAGLGVNIYNARKGKTTERIRFFVRLQGAHRFFVNKKCVNLIEALKSAVWNEKSGVDERLDNGTTNIDSLDAMEYAVEKLQNSIDKAGVYGENN